MNPRPRARDKVDDLPEPAALAAEIARIRRLGGEPAAIVVHLREWRRMQALPGFSNHWRVYPGDEHTFDAVPVILRRSAGGPKLYATQADLEDALLGAD